MTGSYIRDEDVQDRPHMKKGRVRAIPKRYGKWTGSHDRRQQSDDELDKYKGHLKSQILKRDL